MTTEAGSNIVGAVAPHRTGFANYLFAHAAWFLAFGVQMVLFPYLVRVILQENAVRFGLAQMCLQLPTTLLILLGGFVADRTDTKRTIVIANLLNVGMFGVLGVLVISGHLTYELLIGYALVMGVIGAFAMPARDALLSQVAPEATGIQRAVALTTMAQFAGQILGMILAVMAPLIGVGPLFIGQGVLMGVAALVASRLTPRPRQEVHARGDDHPITFLTNQIREGFSAAMGSAIIAPVVICAVGMGLFFMGAFAVLLPLIVQGYFPESGGDKTKIASALGAFSLCFWIGSMISASILIRFGALKHKGIIYLCALALGGMVLVACSIHVPMWVLFMFNFVWGLGGGVAMTLGRGLIQGHAPAEKRARILSIFTLGTMGGAPLGAPIYGFLAHNMDPHQVVLFPGIGMLALVVLVAAFSKLRHVGD